MKTLVVLIALLGLGVFPLIGESRTATVRIRAVDQFGTGAGTVEVIEFLYGGPGGKNYNTMFRLGEAVGLPYGRYSVTLQTHGFLATGWVHVYEPEVFAVLKGQSMFIEYGPGSGPLLSGTLKGLPAQIQKPIWIRIINVYQEDTRGKIVSVEDNGAFSTRLDDLGLYVLVVLNDRGALYSGTVRAEKHESKIVVDLSKPATERIKVE